MLAQRPHPNDPSLNHSSNLQNNAIQYGGPSVTGHHSHQLPPELFIAIFDFETQEPDQVRFKRGDVLPIVLKEPSGWWAAFVDGRYGWVPAAFLEPWSPHQEKSGAPGPSPGLSMSNTGGSDGDNQGLDTSGMRPRGSITAQSVADLPEYTEQDTYKGDDIPSILSPEYEYYAPGDPVHTRRRSSEYTEEEPRTAGGMAGMNLDEDDEDPLVSDLVAQLSDGGLGQSRRTGASGALPPYAMHSPQSSNPSPTSHNNYNNFNSRNGGGGNGGSHVYAPTYDPPIPHQLSLVLEEGSDVNSQWSMAHSSQAFSHTSSQSALNQMALQRSRGEQHRHSSLRINTNSINNSGSLQAPLSPLSPSNPSSGGTAALHRLRIAHLSTPWYLRPKHAWDELKLDADGLVVAGTAPALIERLLMDSVIAPHQEAALRSTLLLTFKNWTTAETLYDTLLEYYTMEEPEGLELPESLEWKEKKLRPTQMRVLCVFGLWIEKHGLLVDDPGLVPRLRTWLSTILSPTGLALSAKQLVQSIDRIQHADDSLCQTTASPISPFGHLGASLRRKPKPPRADFLKWDTSEVANHLTLAEARAYSRLRPSQCLAWAQAGGKVRDVAGLTADAPISPGSAAGGDQDGGVRNLMDFIAESDRLAIWVKSTVLGCESLGRRTDIVDFWIKIADRCRGLNNIYSMSAIITALSGGDVGKLTLTWAHISRAWHFEQMAQLTDAIGNFSAYRAFHASLSNQPDGPGGSGTSAATGGRDTILSTCSPISSTSNGSSLSLSISTLSGRDGSNSNTGPACIPFIAPFLTDLMHINDRFPTTVQTPPGPEPSQAPPRPLINVVKLQLQAEVISNMLRFVDRVHLTGSHHPSGGKGPGADGYRSLVEKENPAMVAAMEAQMEAAAAEAKKDAAYFWKRSQELQLIEVTHADIWKNLNNAGF